MTTFEVQFITITDEQALQRIDNYLITKLKGAPKSLIYRIVRKGEVRVNKKRIKPDYKLQVGDELRIPPLRMIQSKKKVISPHLKQVSQLQQHILFEDEHIMVINKPSGLAVHGGSGLSFGVIEALRALRPESKFMELVHRLDRDTSGILLVAKKRSALRALHEQLQMKKIQKIYLALVRGQWQSHVNIVKAPLLKNILQSGERIVCVNKLGKVSQTHFSVEQRFQYATLIRAMPVTGRTHQIRVHCQYAGHPIAFDNKYGDCQFDIKLMVSGLNRLFLHARTLVFSHPKTGKQIEFNAPLDKTLETCLSNLCNIKN